MRIIALHNGHDSSVTALEDGELTFHLELERSLCVKHFAGVSHANEVPEAMNTVLSKLGWSLPDCIVLSGLVPWGGNWQKTEFCDVVKGITYGKETTNPYVTWQKRWRGRQQAFAAVTHHMGHMAYSYYTSPFTESLLLAVDGRGDFAINTAYGVGIGNKINYLGNTAWENPASVPYNNIGITYSCLGHLFPFLGLDALATAGKAMGLSSYGQPVNTWREGVRSILFPAETTAHLSPHEPHLWAATEKAVSRLRQSMPLNFNDPNDPHVHNLMATIQDETEAYMVSTARHLAKKYQQKKRLPGRRLCPKLPGQHQNKRNSPQFTRATRLL